jgi:hypothetical protein
MRGWRLVFEDGRWNGWTLRDWLPEVDEDICGERRTGPDHLVWFGGSG